MSDETILLRTDGTGVWRGDTGLATHDAAGAPTREAVEAELRRVLALRDEAAGGPDTRLPTWDEVVAATKRAEAAEARCVELEAKLADERAAHLGIHRMLTEANRAAEAAEAALAKVRAWAQKLLDEAHDRIQRGEGGDRPHAPSARLLRQEALMSYLLAFLLPEPVDPTPTPTPPPETPHKPTSAIPGASAGVGGEVARLTAMLLDAPTESTPYGGFKVCACHGGALTSDEARAGSLCEGCGGRR